MKQQNQGNAMQLSNPKAAVGVTISVVMMALNKIVV